VENLWITLPLVDNFSNKVSSPPFPQAINTAVCGNVEKTCLIAADRSDNQISA
jgi:hypothetical protein